MIFTIIFYIIISVTITFLLNISGLLSNDLVSLATIAIFVLSLYKHYESPYPQEDEQQQHNNNTQAASVDDDDDTDDDNEDYNDGKDYGPEGSVIWGPRTIEENICINGKWYINENSEEWEENEGC